MDLDAVRKKAAEVARDEYKKSLKKKKSEKNELEMRERIDKISRTRTEPRISYKYYRGEYLVYDCQDRHFACVNDESFELCQKFRSVSLKERRKGLGCVPLKKFKTHELCFKKNYSLIHKIKDKSFCINPNLL